MGLSETQSRIPRLCLFGAAPDTANLGVSALFLSVVSSVAARYPNAALTVFDFGRGVRIDEVEVNGRAFRFARCGANLSRRYYRKDSLFNMRMSAALGGLANPGVRAMAEADAVLDISGGDSFSDIYGDKRFESMTQPKRLALRLGAPLVLLPQTYGPFDRPKNLRIAKAILGEASMAWARDGRSFEVLQKLLGERTDDQRHCSGVDVAFALPRSEPESIPERLTSWLFRERSKPIVGFNVSGLIYNQGPAGSRHFGFKDDYQEIVRSILRRFINQTDALVLLVPHVLARLGHYESDPQACGDVAAALGNDDERVLVLDGRYNAMEMKWVIAQLDFFCGTRMHSTVAALSSGIPTTAIAYSGKTAGVFETCGQGDCVADPRFLTAQQCVEKIWQAWERRELISASLVDRAGEVRRLASEQFSRVFDHIDGLPRHGPVS